MTRALHSPIARAGARRQRGVTLIEALVALLVMSFGMLALVGLMSSLRLGADLAKQRSEAMRIARAQIATLRDFSVLTTAEAVANPGLTAYDDLLPTTNNKPSFQTTPADSNTAYTVNFGLSDLPAGQGKLVRVSVEWTDRASGRQFVNLDTVIARIDPVFSAVVGFVPQSSPIALPSGRNPVIPAPARKLNKDISVFRPDGAGSALWVFNNLTGVITSTCTLGDSQVFANLTAADLNGCTDTTSYLLSGTVRFSNADPARPGGIAGDPEANAVPLDLNLVGGNFSVPTTRINSAGATVTGTITASGVIAPTKAANGVVLANDGSLNTFYCFNDSAYNGLPFVTYNCIVTPTTSTPPAPRSWSGQLQLTGLTTGTNATQYRVCRYSADYNGNGGNLLADGVNLDNQEHPLVYIKVVGSLARQNFLVIRGNVACPSAANVDQAAGIFADYKTVQLQP